MRMLMGEGRIVRHVFTERWKRWHLNVIRIRCIVRSVPTVADGSADTLEETFRTFDAVWHRHGWFRLWRVSVYLCGIEYGVSTGKEQAGTVRGMFPTVLRFGRVICELPENYRRGFLSLPNLGPAFLPLSVRSPFAGVVTLRFSSSPQTNRVDTPDMVSCWLR